MAPVESRRNSSTARQPLAPANLQAEWARLLLGSLADAGVRHVVVSPGSRSTPFVLAACAEPRLRLWDLVDERSAGFFALGLGKATGCPALALATSGTAGANYLPAVVEAGASGAPLLVLTADRPFELHDCGANQTIDQLGLYGAHARRFFELGAPDAAAAALRGLRRIAAQAVFTALEPEPGAVHLNARARKPLEPRPPETAQERHIAERVEELLAAPVARPSAARRLPEAADVAELARRCREVERGLLVCGPAPLAAAAVVPPLERLAALAGFPLHAEPASQARFGAGLEALRLDALDLLLESPAFRARLRPELVIQVGRAPTSGTWGRHLDGLDGAEHWVIAPHGWQDPAATADRLLFADVAPTLEAVAPELGDAPRRESAWTAELARAEELAWEAVSAELAAAGGLSEGAVARAAVAALPEGALLALGNSLPIREVETFCPSGRRRLGVFSQRGASGIDGFVSAAAGAAAAWDGPALALVGDLSFVHDLYGLAAARALERTFVVLVVQNRGGRIFERLPLASDPAAEGVFDHWTTPHDLDFAGAAALHRLPFARATTLEELESALARALEHPGATVVEAVVPEHGAAAQRRRLRRRVDDLLQKGWP